MKYVYTYIVPVSTQWNAQLGRSIPDDGCSYQVIVYCQGHNLLIFHKLLFYFIFSKDITYSSIIDWCYGEKCDMFTHIQ